MSQSAPDQCFHTAANGTACTISHTMPSGEVWTRCTRCGKTTKAPPNITSEVLNLATEMGFRMGQSVATMVAATEDSRALPMQAGGQTAHFNYEEQAGHSTRVENNPVKLDSDRRLKAV